MRLPPNQLDNSLSNFTEGMEVEVFSRSNEREACGWWMAVIKVRQESLSISALNPCVIPDDERRIPCRRISRMGQQLYGDCVE